MMSDVQEGVLFPEGRGSLLHLLQYYIYILVILSTGGAGGASSSTNQKEALGDRTVNGQCHYVI